MNSAKNNILKRLQNVNSPLKAQPATIDKMDAFYPEATDELDILFAQAFQKNGGKFIYCESQKELMENLHLLAKQRNWSNLYCWNQALQQIFERHNFAYCTTRDNLINSDAGITTCEALIARTGSILLSSNSESGRSLSIVPPVHIVIATPNQVVYNLKEVLSLQTARADQWPSMLCFTSTNSRTADIEKTLVNGAHGPKEIFVFMLDI
ncbi:LutC/YkgG family protein [Aureispira anguillae]|uniref:Lactate utilization protein n=1 Tax=Aureispira anguillae TaxID=2864201 RepID=A0A915YIW3_9BACT|nr:lactate utilization protein [Aureispira anguillae]BDS13786.1 lactate utilization protein [Aureispira anguillae]